MKFWLAVLYCLLPLTARAGFLLASDPARAVALGGNLVALPSGTSGPYYNSAALGIADRLQVSARYEQLFAGIANDNLGSSALTVQSAWGGAGALRLAWDHFGADFLQQDRLKLAWGRDLDPLSKRIYLGLSLAWLNQSFTLSQPLAGVNTSSLSARAFSVGGGLMLRPWSWFNLGFSAQDINEPNLGVIGVSRLGRILRWGAAIEGELPLMGKVRLTAAQTWSQGDFQNHAGIEWEPMNKGLRLRGGLSDNSFAVGAGWYLKGLQVDYSYLFSSSGAALPGNHAVEISYAFGSENPRLKRATEKARVLTLKKDWSGAAWYYRKALDLNPKDTDLLREQERVLRAYRAQRGKIYLNSARRAERQGRLSEALVLYRWARQFSPAKEKYNQALARIKKRQAEQKLSFKKSLHRKYKADLSKRVLSTQAQETLRQVLELRAGGKAEEAREQLLPLLRRYPYNAALLELQNFLRAPVFKKAQAARALPDNRVLLLQYEAGIYESKGRTALALKTWKKILKLDPDNPLALQKIKINSSSQSVSKAQKKKARDLFNWGLMAYEKGDVPGAIALWQKALKKDPSNRDALNNLARAKMELEESVREIKK